jgi:hypothetical protein
MSKEEYYSKIKKLIYRKFDELEVVERNDGNTLYLRYKNKGYAEILIKKISGEVYYNYEFRIKFFKIIHLEMVDFEFLLKRWVEDTFQMKVRHSKSLYVIYPDGLLMIPTK